MEVAHVVFGIPGRFEEVKDRALMEKFQVTAHRYLGTSINGIRYYAVRDAALPEPYTTKCTPLFWKVVINGESVLYVELDTAATEKINKFMRKESHETRD
jgi:hypothetical protein